MDELEILGQKFDTPKEEHYTMEKAILVGMLAGFRMGAGTDKCTPDDWAAMGQQLFTVLEELHGGAGPLYEEPWANACWNAAYNAASVA